ncbi:MAG: SIS domain-containing protein [Chitinophagaceae bacterium]
MINTKANPFLGYSLKELTGRGAGHTALEITQQPKLWLATWATVAKQQRSLEIFFHKIFDKENLDIILTGAGTSAFIGNILEGPFQKNTRIHTRAVASTDLVSHPDSYFHPTQPSLLISFARSGNSPESLAAVDLANRCCKEIYHLIITCNPDGKLAINAPDNQSYVFLLPPEADDQGLAMTGSFTCMLLAGLLLSRLSYLHELKKQVERLSEYGEKILSRYISPLQEIARLDFKRAVFLGSGPLQGASRESQLKLQELTDGKVICKHDSFLGFRHGPKVVLDNSTLLVYLFSNKAYVHQYETDLVFEINAREKSLFSIGVSESRKEGLAVDLQIVLSNDDEKIDEEFLAVCCVLPAQILGFLKSLQLGLEPDMPSVSGSIARVVEGVTIYPFTSDAQTIEV